MVIRVGTRPAGKRQKVAVSLARNRDTSDEVLVPNSRLKLPHERDETPNARRTANRVTRQAYSDVTSGQEDTDRRGEAVASFRRTTGTRAKTGTRPVKRKKMLSRRG